MVRVLNAIARNPKDYLESINNKSLLPVHCQYNVLFVVVAEVDVEKSTRPAGAEVRFRVTQGGYSARTNLRQTRTPK